MSSSLCRITVAEWNDQWSGDRYSTATTGRHSRSSDLWATLASVTVPEFNLSSVQVNIVGNWNPSIFVPRWFANVGLLPVEEVDTAKIGLIHEEMAHFSLPWINVQVTRDRFVVTTNQDGYAGPLRDLAVGTLELLAQTPIRMMGINHEFLLDLPSRAAFDGLGWSLADPSNWPNLSKPGIALLQMQGARTDGYNGYIRVKVEPILDNSYRVSLGVNDHYDLGTDSQSASNTVAKEILGIRWQAAAEEAIAIVDHLRSVGKK
jgi:hypothetical protein